MSEATPTAEDFQPPAALAGVQRAALAVGVLGTLGLIAGFVLQPERFFQSYLVGWFYWLAISLGCLGWSMIQHLTGGTWALVLRRTFEAGTKTLPLLLVLALPFLFGMNYIYPWARPEAIDDSLIQAKAAYLNVPFFWVRVAICFGIWLALTYALNRNSQKQDATGDPKSTVAMRMISGPGLVLLVVSGSFTSWDWLMSTDPHWFSSLYGFWFISSTALAGLCFGTIWAWWLHKRQPMQGVFKTRHFHDYGKLTLALTMFWAYMTLSQFLITYSGNVPEFTIWYLHRNDHGWKIFTVLLVIFHFFVPFLILLSAKIKQQPGRLVMIAFYMLFMRWMDLYWQAAPNFHKHLTFHALDLAAIAGVGGLWVWFFIHQLQKHTLLPLNDPFMEEVLGHA
ncbi:MAG: hypothetical protein AAF690_08840 [Acidobacteriota bacterium]